MTVRRGIALLLAVLLTLGLMPLSAAAEDWIDIDTAEKLAAIDDDPANKDANYRLTADLDLSGIDWTPLFEGKAYRFTGTLDGQGHVIRHLTVTGNHPYAGLFAQIVPEDRGNSNPELASHLMNVSLLDVTVNVTGSGDMAAGAFVGWWGADVHSTDELAPYPTNTLANCCASGSITAETTGTNALCEVGGLAGYGFVAQMSFCSFTGTVKAVGNNAAATGNKLHAGGLYGYAIRGGISGCYAAGTVTAAQKSGKADVLAGGLSALSDQGDNAIMNSVALCTVSCTGTASAIGTAAASPLTRVISDSTGRPLVSLSNSYYPAGCSCTVPAGCTNSGTDAGFAQPACDLFSAEFQTGTLGLSTNNGLAFADGYMPRQSYRPAVLTAEEIPDQTGTGKPLTPALKVIEIGHATPLATASYRLIYLNNVTPCNAKTYPDHGAAVILYSTGPYADVLCRLFSILPAAPKITVKSGSDGVIVSWKAVADATSYEVQRKTGSGSWTRLKAVNAPLVSYTDRNAAAGKTYSYRVSATYGRYLVPGDYATWVDECTGRWSAAGSLTVAPAKVTGVAYKATSKTAITLSWKKVAGAAGYQIYNAGTKKAVATTTKLTYQIGKLKAGTTYNYQVRAYVLNGSTKVYGAYSTKLATTTLPAAPTVTLATTAKKVTAKWGKVTGATSYQVQLATNKAISKGVKKATVTGVSKAFTGLKKGTTYYVRVRTAKKLGTKTVYSAWSAVKSIKCK